MPLSRTMFRVEGGDIAALKASQRARFESEELIDTITEKDAQWRALGVKQNLLSKTINAKSKDIGKLKRAGTDTTAAQQEVRNMKEELESLKAQGAALDDELKKLIRTVGNIVHPSVPVSQDEALNATVRTWGTPAPKPAGHHHHEVLAMIDGYSPEQGRIVAGHRGYFLKGVGVLLNQALINYGLALLMKHGYTPLQAPFFMNKDIMAETAQLEQFDEELYRVSYVSGSGGAGEQKGEDSKEAASERTEKYLIATSEQPISAYHRHDWIDEKQLPIRYAGFSTCFRKEAGSHGKDTWGIFRVHQFEKIEQFVVCKPEESWQMHEQMLAVAEEFYQTLKLPYRVVNIVSGELNNAAAKKYDLEAWFPVLGDFRELVSCSNCTDYQARAMETRCGQKKLGSREKRYCHMLNATLCATERTMCCLIENWQTEEGVVVPEVLRPFMAGMTILPFVKPKPEAPQQSKGKNKGGKKKQKKQK